MSDPIKRLQEFGTGDLDLHPMPAAQVRRFGDQRRRRRNAAVVAVSAAAMVAVIVPTTLLVVRDNGNPPITKDPTPSPTQTPSPTPNRPLGIGNIPAGFPLDLGAPDMTGDGGEMRGPSPDVETGTPTVCTKDPVSETVARGRLGFSSTGPEFEEQRELRTFPNEETATSVMEALRAELVTCKSWEDEQNTHTVTGISADTGADSVTYAETIEPLGGVVRQVTRVGTAILTIAQYGEWSPSTAVTAGKTDLVTITERLTPEMCVFTEGTCGGEVPGAGARTITYPWENADDPGVWIRSEADLAKLRNAPDSFKDFVKLLLADQEAEPDSACAPADPSDNQPIDVVGVTRLSTAGYAYGFVGGCDGHSALWSQSRGSWIEVIETHEIWSCTRLAEVGVPVSFVGSCMNDDGQVEVGGDFGPDGVDGIELGMPAEEVEAVGGAVRTVPDFSCTELYLPGSPPGVGTPQGYLQESGVVLLYAVRGHSTPEGVTFGVARSAVQKAYPDGRLRPGVDGESYWDVPLPGDREYRFHFSAGAEPVVLGMELGTFATCDGP